MIRRFLLCVAVCTLILSIRISSFTLACNSIVFFFWRISDICTQFVNTLRTMNVYWFWNCVCHSICRFDKPNWSSVSQSLQICANTNMECERGKKGRIDEHFEIGNFSILLLNREQQLSRIYKIFADCFFPLLVLVQILGIMNKSILSYPKRNVLNSLGIGYSNEVFNPIEIQHNKHFSTEMRTSMRCYRCNWMQQFVISIFFNEFIHRMQFEQFRKKTEIRNFFVYWAMV